MRQVLKALVTSIAFLLGLFGVMQLVPYGRAHSNPRVLREPAWDSPRTRELAARACFDCHSNETSWPWYAHVAPLSWVLQRDVEAGRAVINFSEWTRPQQLSHEAGGSVLRQEMPPRTYLVLHADAKLTADEAEELARGLHATLGLAWRE